MPARKCLYSGVSAVAATTDILGPVNTVEYMKPSRNSEQATELLASIDALLADVDTDHIDRVLAAKTNVAAEGYIARFGDDVYASYRAAQHQAHLIDNDGFPRVDDAWGLRHPGDCRCTLCLDVDEIPVNEGRPWLAACPSIRPWPRPQCEETSVEVDDDDTVM